jgi:DNA polymerase III sliding clamp (beta) subunit (PCNA family)
MNRIDLVNALRMVMPGIGDKNVLLEGSSSFMFDGDWVKTFNDEISVSYPFKTGLKCLVKAKEFYDVLSKMESEEIKLDLLKDGKLQLSSGKTVLKMASLDISSLAALVNNLSLENIKWRPLSENFLKGLDICSQFASTDTSFSSLCGVSVDDDGLIASDRTRAGFYRLLVKTTEDFILRIGSVKDLIKFKSISQFSVGESWIHFRDEDGVCFSVRKYKVEFPRDTIKKFMDFDNAGEEYCFPEELKSSIERASVMAFSTKEGNEYVSLSLDKKGDLIVTGSKEFGEIEERIIKSKDWSFPRETTIQVNPACLLSSLSIGRKFFIKENQFLLMKNGNLESVIALIVD